VSRLRYPHLDRPIAAVTVAWVCFVALQLLAFRWSPTLDVRVPVKFGVVLVAAGLLVLLATFDEVERGVYWPLLAGTALLGSYAVTDFLDDVVVHPQRFSVVFEDAALLGAMLAFLFGVFRWDRRRTERERELDYRRERLAAKTDQLETFANVVSHDLRNPLTVAYGRLDMLQERLDDPDATTPVREELARMERIVDDVLLLARSEDSADTAPVSLETVARTAWDHVDTGNATLVVEADRQLRADAGLLGQAFENCVRNAIEHAGDAPTVTVGATDTTLFVADDGPGIPAADRGRVLESGVTSSEDGTGFGLAIVDRIASAHGWTVRLAESEPGGLRIEFAVPTHPVDETPTDPPSVEHA
jgi:signal transduction histidine kinase